MTHRRSAQRTAVLTLAVAFVAACAGESSARSPAEKATAVAPNTSAAVDVPGPSANPPRSPETFRVAVETSRGSFAIDVRRALAPRGADRLHELVTAGYFTDVRFFRVVPGFIVQFGMHGDPAVNARWEKVALQDDPRRIRNTRGTVVFAASGPNSRTVQLFINTANNGRKLDGQRLFAPLGTVVEGMAVVDSLNSEYGEEPNYSRIASKGNVYLQRWFPALDYIKAARIVPTAARP